MNIVEFTNDVNPTVIATVSLQELLSGNSPAPFANRVAWKKLQEEDPDCATAAEHIAISQPLPKKNRRRDARNYFNNACLSKPDNLLVVRETIAHLSKRRVRLVIP